MAGDDVPGEQSPQASSALEADSSRANSYADDIKLSIPLDRQWAFVGEGSANIVFEYVGTDDLPYLNGRLLRLPKHNGTSLPYTELQQYWDEKIRPLFDPKNLVQQCLVRLPDSPLFIRHLNDILLSLGLERRPDFRATYISEEVKIGMLIEDMRIERKLASRHPIEVDHWNHDPDNPYVYPQYVTFEIKLKWLTQSAAAPRNAVICRNCAREVYRRDTTLLGAKGQAIICPLHFMVASDFYHDEKTTSWPLNFLATQFRLPPDAAAHFKKWFGESSLLKTLRRHQWENDHEFVWPPTDREKKCLAMTLRDCSLILQIPTCPVDRARGCRVVAKLLDLDKKNFDAKGDYWFDMERRLRGEGYYTSRRRLARFAKADSCQLRFYKNQTRHIVSPEILDYYLKAGLQSPPPSPDISEVGPADEESSSDEFDFSDDELELSSEAG